MLPAESDDDFANDKNMQKLRKQKAEFQKMVNDSVKIIADPFNATESGHKNLKHFMLHKSIQLPFVSRSYTGNWRGQEFYFSLFEYESSVHAGRVNFSGYEYYLEGVIELKKSYPLTVIQPETLALKVENIFTKVDVDLVQNKKFSRAFHMITKDRALLEVLLSNKDLNRLSAYSSAEIELNGNECYFRESRKAISIEQAEKFAVLARILFETF